MPLRTKRWITVFQVVLALVTWVVVRAGTSAFPQEDFSSENVAKVRQTLQVIAQAARQNDEAKVVSLLAPALRPYYSVEVRYVPEINETITIKHSVWHTELERAIIAAVAEKTSIEMIAIHNTKSGLVWEVFVKNESPHLTAASLWYFIPDGDKLLVRDSLFFPSPQPFKRFVEDSTKSPSPSEDASAPAK